MSTEAKDDVKVLEKVRGLIRLANDKDDDEGRNAAIVATRLMKEHELVLIPKSELERVKTMIQGANALATKHKEEAQSKMVLGVLGGMLLSKHVKL